MVKSIEDEIKQKLESLIMLSDDLLLTHNSLDATDMTGRLITYFMLKQREHAISVTKLYPSIDIILIIRTMIEGTINLSWVLEKKEERVKDWFDFSAAYNSKILAAKEKYSSSVTAADKQEILKRQEELDNKFFKKSNRKKTHDNFRCSKSLRDIASGKPALEDLYEGYQHFSDWTHWGSSMNIYSQDNKEIFGDIKNYYGTKAALIYALESLLVTCQFTNNHFKLGFETTLNDEVNSLINYLKQDREVQI